MPRAKKCKQEQLLTSLFLCSLQADTLTDAELAACRAAVRAALGQAGPLLYTGPSAAAKQSLGQLLGDGGISGGSFGGGSVEGWQGEAAGSAMQLPLAVVAVPEGEEEAGR